jgi:hypothetical protein
MVFKCGSGYMAELFFKFQVKITPKLHIIHSSIRKESEKNMENEQM